MVETFIKEFEKLFPKEDEEKHIKVRILVNR